MKLITSILFSMLIVPQFAFAFKQGDTQSSTSLEETCKDLRIDLSIIQTRVKKANKQIEQQSSQIQQLAKENMMFITSIDSLKSKNTELQKTQENDREAFKSELGQTNGSVNANNTALSQRTLYGATICLALIILIIVIVYLIMKKMKDSSSSIDEVRKAQEALQCAQLKISEESVKLDSKLLEFAEKQINSTSTKVSKGEEPDHSLVVKLADEIARIETNLSKMDKSVKGYKQLVQAKDRMINNVCANGYQIVSLMGQDYNDGMQFEARFVPDETLEEGKRIITGMIKMQVNYNGKMIQPAQIVVSQNI